METLFISIHKKHLGSMGSEMKREYGAEQIKKVRVNQKENCFEVSYKNGEWFKYFANGTWG